MEFEDASEAKAWADEWVAARIPSDLVLAISQAERDHFGSYESEFGRFIGQFEVAFTALAEVIDALNSVDRRHWPPHRYVQYVLIAHNMKSFHSAHDRLARGYYEDAITLIRGLYETFVRIIFVSCFPDDAYNSLAIKLPKGQRRFNLTNFLRDDLGLDWETKYEIMSLFAHSNSLRTLDSLSRASRRVGGPERFAIRHEWDPHRAEIALPFLQFTLLAHLRFTTERLLGPPPVVEPDLEQTAREAVDLLSYCLRDSPTDYWVEVSTDLDLLFDMLDVADTRGDWKEYLAGRR